MPTISLSVSLRSHLRSSVAIVDPYEVNSFTPDFVLDFKNSVYKTGGTDTTLSSAVTHARAGNATMVDSDGLLKWSPHNLLTRSEELNLWTQVGTGSVVVDNAVAPDGTTTAATLTMGSTTALRYIRSSGTYTAGDIITYSFWARSDTVTTLPLGINGGTNGDNNSIFSDVTVTSTWQLVEFEFTVLGSDTSLYYIIGKQGDNPVINQLGDIEIWHPHAYRSDLGGMVNNSATGNSYVPTTSSPVYAPRVGHHVYNGSAWVNEGVLHESEARTNFYLNSSLTKTNSSFNITKTSDSAVSPDGTTTADLITPINAGRHLFQYSSSYSANDGSKEIYSFYVKSNGYNLLEVSQRNQGGGTVTKFDLSAVTATTTGGTEIFKSIEDVGNGWYRCSASFITNSVNPYPAVEFLDTDGSQGFTADGTSGIYFWGHQLEAGSTPSSYIPTSSSTVTRAADTLTVPAANLPYSSTNMSIQMDGKMTYADNNLAYSTGHWTAGEATWFRWSAESTEFLYAGIHTIASRTGQMIVSQRTLTSAFSSTTNAFNYFTPNTNVPFNIATRHSSTFLNGAEGGIALTAATPTDMPDLSNSNLELGYIFMGTIGQFRVWDEDLGDTGIAEASAPSTEPSLQLTFDGLSTNSFTVLDWSE